MIPKECKRLAEVDFPVAEVSRHSAREKSIRHGHPSTLHLWWARRPLVACRAMLMALLLPDPCDVNCPAEFREEARQLLKPMPNCGATGSNKELRDALLKFIADFANWDNSAKPAYLECARGLVKAAHGEEPPLVVDPFAGGGSIPLEALRIGCDAFASDLNPVACLILKVLLEDIPRHGPELAEGLRRVGKEIKEKAEKELEEFYPVDPDGARPIAYLWARTVRCEAVGCGAEIPLMRSFWLCNKANRRRALRLVPTPSPDASRQAVPHGRGAAGEGSLSTLISPKGSLRFEIFEPKSEAEVRKGTVARGNAACPCCNTVLRVARVRAQLSAQRGGADVIFAPSPHPSPGGRGSSGEGGPRRVGGARLLAVVTLDENKAGRQYRLPAQRDYEPVWKAAEALDDLAAVESRNGLSPVPDETIPRTELRRISLPIYGVDRFRDMFTSRQLLSLACLAKLIRKDREGYREPAINRLMTLCLDKTADLNNANAPWKPDAECPVHTLARHDIAAAWDFAEAAPLRDASGSFDSACERTANAIGPSDCEAQRVADVQAADACNHPLPDACAAVWFTDPPYYDSVPYAHLSDFFFVWARRALRTPTQLGQPLLTPKDEECVVDRPHSQIPEAKTAEHFEERISLAMCQGVRVTNHQGIGCVVFAHKTTEGWEALLTGITHSGWTITGSWPITTEMQTRLNARDNASLAASVHLVCRPRSQNAGIGGWEDILRELPNRIGGWMERLSGEGIRGADLVFSCVGPALELFSKYEKVETAEGELVELGPNPAAGTEGARRGFLSYVWEVVGRAALQQVLGTAEARARNSTAGALEEDARLTALFLWTLQSTNGQVQSQKSKVESEEEESEDEEEEESAGKPKKGYVLIYDVARRFAQPLGIHLENWEGRIVETKKGVVRLIPVVERAEQLFGQAGTEAAARAIERSQGESTQFTLFPDQERVPDTPIKTRKAGRGRSAGLQAGSGGAGLKPGATQPREATTLDRVHAAMLLQSGGQATALRAMVEAETQRSPDFLRLANALSALYQGVDPKCEEKRLLDAMLLLAA